MKQPKPAYLISSAQYPEKSDSLMEYAKAAQPIFQAYGAEVLVAGVTDQAIDLLEGQWPSAEAKISVVRFPSMQQLKDCLTSSDYLAIKHLRTEVVDTHFALAVD